jgi:TRAP-type C4-dicarboxylate transport system permease small subunit
VVNAVLSLLAIIFIVLIVLGGFRWMTSAGNATKIETAKETITNAVIGLVVVLAAYAISEFILRALTESTSGGGGDVVS